MEAWTEDCDLLVAGSGAAGLAAAVTAAHRGLKVILAEKDDLVGGTTAWSGGWIWAPCNPVARKYGIVEEGSEPRRYLEAVLGPNFNAELVESFLNSAPEMVDFFEKHTDLHFDCGTGIPDTYGHLQGAGTGGRSVVAKPFDGRRLGKKIATLRPTMRETSFLGMAIQAGPDLRAFMTATRSPASAIYATRRLARHILDLALHRRGMQLRNGNALVARLYRSALDKGVDIRTGYALHRLISSEHGVDGAILTHDSTEIAVRVRRGVVLACGGYPHDEPRRNATFPAPTDHLTLAVPAATGDGLRLGETAGGRQHTGLAAPAAFCPVSQLTWPDGTKGIFPHIIDRGKPGVIGVRADGKRFCNEGLGYHDYVVAMLDGSPGEAKAASWLVCDRRFLRRYGLGIVRPFPVPIGWWLKSGYLKTGRTVEALARACGLDADGLSATVLRFNEGARTGVDPDFHRGTSPYMRLQGDPDIRPNPCVAAIETPPFYAVKVVPGSFGTFAGLRTDGSARVLDNEDRPIRGLYAAGTDMASVMGGHYPAGGINLGPALTFGFIAGRHASGTTL